MMKGFLLIDKEKGLTSFDVVRQVRKLTRVKKVGHAGTLDPLATGLLLVAIGEGTKLLEFFIGCDKRYVVKAKFGFVSDSYDAEGPIHESDSNAVFEKEDLEKIIKERFLGAIDQLPPKYSALKIGGRRASDIVRAGGEVELKARPVKIDRFEIVKFVWPEVDFIVECSTGTYIRSLVNDLGEALGCGAYVLELRRDMVGDFDLSDAVKLDVLSKNIEQRLVSLEQSVKGFESLSLSDADFEGLADGKVLLGKKVEQEVPVMAFYKDKLVGVLKNAPSGRGIKFRKVIF